MICTDTDNYVNVLSTIKKERKKKKKNQFLMPSANIKKPYHRSTLFAEKTCLKT